MAEDKESAEAIVSEVHKKIRGAFDVFDHEFNKTVDVREIGTIIRSLGCFPNEGELHDVIAEIEEEEPTGYIRFEKFLPTMTKVLMERKFGSVPLSLSPSRCATVLPLCGLHGWLALSPNYLYLGPSASGCPARVLPAEEANVPERTSPLSPTPGVDFRDTTPPP
uniref:EF-hand calcium binding domain 2 n=1 Tax=Hucho hucho TaxID=62062 RepID=A0A4W5MKG7_9TELE